MKTILVVDDEARMRKLVKDFLVRKDYEVIEAADGEEAIDLFVEHNDFDLIILDVMMPKMDGWEVCREVRKNSKVPNSQRFQLLCLLQKVRKVMNY